MVPRPIALATVLAIALLSAGCLSGGPATDSTGPDDPGPTPTATDSATPPATDQPTPSDTGATPTPTPFDWVAASNEPDPSKHVYVENRWDETVTIDVRVVRNATGEIVHNGSYDVDPDERRRVYNTSAADPDGIETFTALASRGNETVRVSTETNVCHGSAHVVVTDDGSFDAFYAIC